MRKETEEEGWGINNIKGNLKRTQGMILYLHKIIYVDRKIDDRHRYNNRLSVVIALWVVILPPKSHRLFNKHPVPGKRNLLSNCGKGKPRQSQNSIALKMPLVASKKLKVSFSWWRHHTIWT